METATAEQNGRTMLVSIPFAGKLKSKIGFDIRLENSANLYSWNDYDNTQDTSSINYGTVNLRNLPPVTYTKRGTIDMSTRATRDMDSAWEAAEPVSEFATGSATPIWATKPLTIMAC